MCILTTTPAAIDGRSGALVVFQLRCSAGTAGGPASLVRSSARLADAKTARRWPQACLLPHHFLRQVPVLVH